MPISHEEGIAWLQSTQRLGPKPGLRRIQALLGRMGNPQQHLRFVHVAGTNGKGSVCAMLESVLRAAGYRTGMFISPYLMDFREKIQRNRAWIPAETLARLIGELRETVEKMVAEGEEHPSYFEMVTALGFRYFAEERCDIVVLEVGLGGRLDSTNVIEGCEVASIGSISFDHTEYLGDSLRQIAAEKCGILKKGCAAVSYAPQTEEAAAEIRRHCAERQIPLRAPDLSRFTLISTGLDGSVFLYGNQEYRIGLIGEHQVYNALTVLEIAEALRDRGYSLPPEAVRAGLGAARWAGRLEILRQQPLCILDGAHNEDGMRALAAAIEKLLGQRRLIVVMAMLAKKDYRHCVPLIARHCDLLIATEVKAMPGTLPAADLAALAREGMAAAGRDGQTKICPEAAEAAAAALAAAGEGDVLLACGSLYMIGEVGRCWSEY